MGEAAEALSACPKRGRLGKSGRQKARDVRLHEQPRSRKRICARQGSLHRFEEDRFVFEV